MAIWLLKPTDESRVESIARRFALPPAIARTLVLRGYDSESTVEGFLAARQSIAFLKDPVLTPGMERAVARIRRAVEAQERMVIYGDYDADGVTSASLLYRYLKKMGANVSAFLPNRIRDGYGVTPHAVERIAAQGGQLILTCDNGIAAHEAAATARGAGIDLIVTDHHQVPETLPDCHAIVHPGVEFPHLKDMAGVGVAFLLTLALEGGWTSRMDFLLDFVTIGTVADMVPLDGPNRPLVWAGLMRLRDPKALKFPGLDALAEVSRIAWETLGTRDIAFSFGPRINAAGRLEEPDIGFRLFTTQDKAEARRLAADLERLNVERRTLSGDLEARVLEQLDREWDFASEPFIVLADPTFHPGITGILAGRIKDRYRVPVLLFSPHADGVCKASGRSPEGLNLYGALHAACDHLIGFGGHAQAAGCSAVEESLPGLRRALNRYLKESGWERAQDIVALDAELPFDEATPALLEELDRLEPFGQKNAAPVFGLLGVRVLGRDIRGEHLFLKIDDGRTVRKVAAWRHGAQAAMLSGWVNLTLRAQRSSRNPWDLELSADRIEPAEAPRPLELGRFGPRATLLDRRLEDPEDVLDDLCALGSEIHAVARRPGEVRGLACLDPFSPEPMALAHVVLVGPPPDAGTWERLQTMARVVTLIRATGEPIEAPLTVEEIQGLFRDLMILRGHPLDQALIKLPDLYRGHEAMAIFREAGICVVRGMDWRLLRAPDEAIVLRPLESYRRHVEAVAYRRRWPESVPLVTIR